MRVWFALSSLFALPAHADPTGGGHMSDWGFGFMFGPVLWLVVLGLIVAGVIWLIRSPDLNRGGPGQNSVDPRAGGDADAMAALKMRFAKGEIGEDEFIARKKLLDV